MRNSVIEANGHVTPLSPEFPAPSSDWTTLLGLEPSAAIRERARQVDWRLRPIAGEERERWLMRILQAVEYGNLPRSGPERLDAWETGWRENLHEDNLVPHYFGKHPVVRWWHTLASPYCSTLEYDALGLLQCWLADLFFCGVVTRIWEFGAGTGHNLRRLRNFLGPDVELAGLDWATSSQQIIDRWSMGSVRAERFDFFHPTPGHHMPPGTGVLTCAALEQTGSSWWPFLNYLIANRPRICVHIEPLEELLDPREHLDWLCLRYMQKRGYLSGFLGALHRLQRQGVVKVHHVHNTPLGSLFLRGYQVVVWSPVP